MTGRRLDSSPSSTKIRESVANTPGVTFCGDLLAATFCGDKADGRKFQPAASYLSQGILMWSQKCLSSLRVSNARERE